MEANDPYGCKLRSHSWPAILTTSNSDLIKDFFDPALSLSVAYDRGVGFFSSGWLRAASVGMVQFAKNGGHARWVTSPILSEEDWEALRAGDEARSDPILKQAILRNITDLSRALERETLSAIAWMVADGILHFKLALPRNKLDQGEFHDKFGVFTDSDGQRISFNGSYNDSLQGLRNYESIKVFCSWETAFAPLVESDIQRFESLWTNQDPNVEIFELQEAAKEQILKLRSPERPYKRPPWADGPELAEQATEYRIGSFSIPPWLEIRDYQRLGMQKWRDAGGKGILAMATGSGKTLTALYLACRVNEKIQPLVLIVVCPYLNLANQWSAEMAKFGLRPVQCYLGFNQWKDALQSGFTALFSGASKILPIVVSNRTFLSPRFQQMLRPDALPHFLIADEVHNLGAETIQTFLDQRIQYRLGLSATPERHYDGEGTQAIMEYFGGIVFEFTLADAIKAGVLSRYLYHPILVNLTETEANAYWEISEKIAQCYPKGEDDPFSDYLKMLLIQRARILASAANKMPALEEVIRSLLEQAPVNQAIVYCGDGLVEGEVDQEALRQVTATTRLLGDRLGLRVRKFTYSESAEEREDILNDLKAMKLDAVVAIRCLDEGIDMPDIRTAFILASSTNPRQFIQRRGRLLRKSPGKDYAVIYDFIIRPPDYGGSHDDLSYNLERRLFARELKRILEFCQTAENGIAALNDISELRKEFNMVSI